MLLKPTTLKKAINHFHTLPFLFAVLITKNSVLITRYSISITNVLTLTTDCDILYNRQIIDKRGGHHVHRNCENY